MQKALELPSKLHNAAFEVVAAVVEENRHVLVEADGLSATLDDVARRLAATRSRVLRPATRDPLTLAGLLAQVVGRPADGTLDASDLEVGFDLLTSLDASCDRVVLILDRADAIDAAALRYLQLATRDAPLRLVCAGGAGFRAMLALDEFAATRRAFGLPPERSVASVRTAPTIPIPEDRPVPCEPDRLPAATYDTALDRTMPPEISSVGLDDTAAPVACEADQIPAAVQSKDRGVDQTLASPSADTSPTGRPPLGPVQELTATLPEIGAPHPRPTEASSSGWRRWARAGIVVFLAGGALWYAQPALVAEYGAKAAAAWRAVGP